MDLKTMLEERAEEMRLEPRIPTSVLRRARRRRAATAVLAGAVTAGLALGAFVGARALLDQTGSLPSELRPGGTTEEFYPFIYPPTQEELDTTVAEVADGSMPMWTDPEGVAILFAVNVMGWDMDDVDVEIGPATGREAQAIVTNPTLSPSNEDLRMTLFMFRVPETEMYAVMAAQAEGMEVEPVSPDGSFGTGDLVAFKGRLAFLPTGARIVLTLEDSRGISVEASTFPDAGGRFRVELRSPSGIGPATIITIALEDGSGRTLALTSSRLASPAATGPVETATSEAQVALPGPVSETREAILEAAQARDWNALRALIPDEGFTYSFGNETDPIRYWKRLESEGHEPVIGDILPAVLGTEPGYHRGVFVWPAQANEEPVKWDEADIEALTAIHAEEDVRGFQQAGIYYGWRLGIERDGTWVYFVAGD